MLYFSRWKKIAIVGVCLLGVILCLPNLLPRSVIDALPSWIPARQVNLGLDLQGGSYLLLEVDMDAVIQDRLASLSDSARSLLRREQIAFSDVAVDEPAHAVTFRIEDPTQADPTLRTKKATARQQS